ncbi:hypothetical protein [Spirosoma endbachense]|uniref:Uncharacterized protein n=1 Tax=Spirosoma endbachense TaxID=2666025 RepID=A0A6P1VYS1_9BACT|nr:hypothetical protein [Spirosoma endbachense]QHV96859.1 hypothetical protein GJR95_18405 [Spirosoma endbachense]
MKTSQRLARLEPRIKLVKRHLREWNDLLLHQKEVRRLTQEAANRQFAHIQLLDHMDARMTILELKTRQAVRFAQVVERQIQERKQMKVRHQQEEAELENVLNTM